MNTSDTVTIHADDYYSLLSVAQIAKESIESMERRRRSTGLRKWEKALLASARKSLAAYHARQAIYQGLAAAYAPPCKR